MSERVTSADFGTIADYSIADYSISEEQDPARSPLHVVTLAQFAATEEPHATPLLGSADDSVLSLGGLMLMYGDGGAGKTTLSIDMVAHLAGGVPWLGLSCPAPVRCLLLENEGPRAPLRRRLAAKIAAWQGPPFAHNVVVMEEPWARFTLRDDAHRIALAAEIDRHEIDLLVCGPLVSLGALGGGTPSEVSEFDELVRDLRDRSERAFAIEIVHHENKQGDVSGAWERYPDTLVQVSAQGNGRTHLHWRKVRWSSSLHDTSCTLLWSDGDGAGYELEQPRERDYREELLAALDDQWRTASEWATLIGTRRETLQQLLSLLTDEGLLRYQIGPPGRSPLAVCWRAAALSPGEEPQLDEEAERLLDKYADLAGRPAT